MKVWQQGILTVLVAVAAGCDTGTGPNSLYKFQPATGCTACHSSATSSSLDPLVTNGAGTAGKHVRHVQVRNIPCERCHNGYYPAENHMNGTFDTANPAFTLVLFDSTNPTATWTGDTGPGTGTCASVACHGGFTLDWYGTGLPTCGACHSVQIGQRRPVMGTSGDFASNPSISSHHISGANDPTPEQCQVCHEMSQHMSGIVRLKEADTGAAIVYSASSPSTLEPFCLSCHDADGSQSTFAAGGTPTSPFSDGSTLGVAPYPYATRIQSSWTSTNGHGPNGNHATIKKLTCLGTGQPGTGCHGNNGSVNAHGSVNQVLASRPFKYDNNDRYSAADFSLCFDCHANYPGFTKEDLLGVKLGGILDWEYSMSPSGGRGPNGWAPPYTIPAVVTHFADHNAAGGAYNDPNFFGINMNLHWAHLGILTSNFRGSGTISGINCVNCHDVHGSSNFYGATYNEMGYTNVFPDATNRLGTMTDNAYLTNQLNLHPTFCAGFNCHPMQGPTRAWYYPIAE